MIKAVIFDLDDTLYDYETINQQAMEAVCQKFTKILEISLEEFKEAFQWGKQETKRTMHDCASRHNRIIYFQKASEYLQINPIEYTLDMYETYWGHMLEHMTLFPGVLEMLEHLKRENIKIAVCTDLTAHIQHRKLKKLGIWEYIDVLVTSEEADAEKPDKRIFELIIKKLHMQPQELLYVGDNLKKDIIGSRDAGMLPIWFNIKGNGKTCGAASTEIKSFQELEKVIFHERSIK